jgi:hypothetical protein
MKGFTQHINKNNPDYDVNKKRSIVDPGPYEAIITGNSDTLRTGRIFVYVPAFGGPIENTNSWVPVQYATPYYGKTDKGLVDKQESNGLYSYGMWMTVPDPGVKVIVTFMEGNRDKGVVIGCLIDDVTNHMVPGLPSSKYWIRTPEVAELFPTKQPGVDYMPVIEHNPKITRDEYSQPVKYNRPVNIELAKILQTQGLLDDTVRGQSFSSAQRENNSSVYGISTPGRSLTKDPAQDSNLYDRMSSGNASAEDLQISSRKPGHMFVMDDGDVAGDNSLIRLRTSTGHQILMNDSEGIIYVATASGNAWIEMTNNGDVHVYNKGNFNVHCEGSFNVHAGGNINMEATQGINVSAMGEPGIKVQTDNENANIDIYSANAINIEAADSMDVLTGADITMTSDDNSDIHLNGPQASSATKPTRNDLLVNNGNRDVTNSTSTVVPEHEPWNRGDL